MWQGQPAKSRKQAPAGEHGRGHCLGLGCTPPWARRLVSALVLAVVPGCLQADQAPDIGQDQYSLAEPGPWHIPPETLAIGDQQFVPYTAAGSCTGGLLEGSSILREYLYLYFPQAYSIGGYSCRGIVGNESVLSVHASGRALDIMIRTIDGEADNSAGDVIGNWLIEQAEVIGIQYIIWDRWRWSGSRDPRDASYGGSHPHHDHLHVELSVDAANLITDFFHSPMQPPDILSCGTIAAEGGIIDDGELCAGFYGPTEYWRTADGVGYGGSMLWTNAFSGENPSNWGRWMLDMAEAGSYQVEVYLAPPYAVHQSTHYEVVHDGQVEVLTFDQSQATTESWYPLGTFDFAEGAAQSVSVFDNSAGEVADEQHIAFDAVRLTRCGAGGCQDSEPPDQPGRDSSDVAGGCSTTGGSSAGAGLALLTLVAVRRRRRAKSSVDRIAG